jgi:hypothetical protein
MFVAAGPAFAEEFTAGTVITKMAESDRYPFVLGIIEGISFARYIKDEKETAGMRCIYEWGMKAETVTKIYEAFAKFSDFAPAAIVTAMAEKECGK